MRQICAGVYRGYARAHSRCPFTTAGDKDIGNRNEGGIEMRDLTRPNRIVVTTAIQRLDRQTWAKKSVREAVSIASRANGQHGGNSTDLACVDVVLAMMVEQIEAERRALGHLSA